MGLPTNRSNGLFANISVRTRLLIMVVPLAIAVLGFVISEARHAWQLDQDATNARLTASMAVAIGNAVHEMQQERGLSASYLSKPNQRLRKQLLRKHDAADTALAALDGALEDLPASTPANVDGTREALDRVAKFRDSVLADRVSASEAIRFYSTLNGRLIGMIARMGQDTHAADITAATRALNLLVAVQEAAGKERAVLGGATASGSLPSSSRDQASGLAAQQNLLLQMLQNGRDTALSDAPADGFANDIANLRSRIFKDVGSVSQPQWWDASTRRIDALFAKQGKLGERLLQDAGAELRNAEFSLALAGLGSAASLGALALCWVLGEDMRRRLNVLHGRVKEIEDRSDLTVRTGISGRDEIGGVAARLDRMLEKFSGMVGRVADAANQLAAPAQQLATVSQQTHGGIRRQQSETDQVASAMNEMTAAIQEVARNAAEASDAAEFGEERARQADLKVEGVSDDIAELAAIVEQVTGLMRSLDERAEQMSQVVAIIQGVTEQTNLLALNASIEAARAGEHGRGFAVVATEVRSLAQQTNESTDNIRNLIERLQNTAGDGVAAAERGREKVGSTRDAAQQARAALEEVLASVGTMASMNSQIAAATEEQSATAEEINRNIVNICEVTKQTSQGAEETSGASEALATLAGRLNDSVIQFRV